MTLVRHELKQAWKSLLVWTLAIGSFIIVCLFIYPEMKSQMSSISSIFSSMGMFSSAFGLDTLDFGSLRGFYGVECGNILGIGGALFAALLGISALAKEEKNGTAEFLLTHPLTRAEIITAKLISVLIQVLVLNVAVWLMAVASTAAIGEAVPWKEFTLLHLAYFLLRVTCSLKVLQANHGNVSRPRQAGAGATGRKDADFYGNASLSRPCPAPAAPPAPTPHPGGPGLC